MMISNVHYAIPSEKDSGGLSISNQPAGNSLPGHGDLERLAVVASDGSQWVRVEIQAYRTSVLQPLERQVLLRAQQKLVDFFCRHKNSGQSAVSADLRGLRILESVERNGKIKLVIEVPLQVPDCNRVPSDSSSSADRVDRRLQSRKKDDSDTLSPSITTPKAADARSSDYRNKGDY